MFPMFAPIDLYSRLGMPNLESPLFYKSSPKYTASSASGSLWSSDKTTDRWPRGREKRKGGDKEEGGGGLGGKEGKRGELRT